MGPKLVGKEVPAGRRRRFPLVRPRLPPKVGGRYQLKHLQPLARQLFERVSQLTGIPCERLLPWRGKGNVFPYYRAATHAIHLGSRLSPITPGAAVLTAILGGPKTSVAQHEAIHAVAGLLHSNFPNDLQEHLASAGSFRIVPASATTQPLSFQHKVNEFYRKYGVDGLLVLIVKGYDIQNPQNLDSLEKNTLAQGYLGPSGFSTEGEKWFKRIITTNQVNNALDKIKQERVKRRLPV